MKIKIQFTMICYLLYFQIMLIALLNMPQVCISKLHLRDKDRCYPLTISSQQNHQHIQNLLEE